MDIHATKANMRPVICVIGRFLRWLAKTNPTSVAIAMIIAKGNSKANP